MKKLKQLFPNWAVQLRGELQLESSPVYSAFGNTVALVESFYRDDVEVVVYVNDQEVDTFTKTYEELDVHTLEAVFEVIMQYKDNQEDF